MHSLLSVKRFCSYHGIKKRRSVADGSHGTVLIRSVFEDCGMQTGDCGLQTADRTMETTDRGKMQTADQG